MKTNIFLKIFLALIFIIGTFFYLVYSDFVFAYTADRETYGTVYSDNTSTNFSVKGGLGDPIVGISRSSNYVIDNGLTMDLSMMTMTVPTSVSFGVVTPLVPSFASATITVHMVGARHGYFLQAQRDSSTSTMSLTTERAVAFPDAASWNPAGPGNATATPGENLSFRVMQSGTTANYNSTWWGADDGEGSAMYAGFPYSAQQVMVCPACNFGMFDTVLGYKATPPLSQKNGTYDGTITITALANP